MRRNHASVVIPMVVWAGLLCGTAAKAQSVSVGGRLYDKWWAEARVDAPDGDLALWGSQSSNTRSGPDTWRCKECHGWDYKGVDGAYGSGSHKTGFGGFLDSGLSESELIAWLDGTRMVWENEPKEESLGEIVSDNPWEFVPKVRVGQPGSNPPMPAAIDAGWTMEDVIDVLTYVQTLSTGEDEPTAVETIGWATAKLEARR